MAIEGAGATLRDQLAANFDVAETAAEPVITPAVEPAAPAAEAAAPVEKVDGRKLREHAPDGKFLPKQAEKVSAAATTTATTTKALPSAAQVAPAAEPPKPRPQRPSTWKKDHWEDYDRLATENPKLAEYINQRESEFTRGVSTYKAEADRAKELNEAIAPFMPELQQNNIHPAQWIRQLGNAHKMLAMGQPQEKLAMFAQLAQQYRVPLQELFVQGQDGKISFNEQLLQQQVARPQQQQQPQDIKAVVQSALTEREAQRDLMAFAQDQKYKHFEAVRETMAQLLEAGLATDYPSAYDAALRLPQHAELYAAEQEQQRATEEQQRREAEAQRVAAARSKTISPKSAPTVGNQGDGKSKGLRAALSENFDAVAGRF